jgi:uncharacterized membrane protein
MDLKLRGNVDLVAVVGLAVLAALAWMALPDGSAARVALTVPVLLFVPGYLLVEAVTEREPSGRRRAVRALVAVGVSPPLVGLASLATAFLPGGFRPLPIVVVLTLACLALATAAFLRRSPGTPGLDPAVSASLV